MPSLRSVKHSRFSALEYNSCRNAESQIHLYPEVVNFLKFEMESLRIILTHNIGFSILTSHWLLVPPIEFHWLEEMSSGISFVYPEFHSDEGNI
ncbi:uncharacterized protein TNCV_1423651 [Trichonephila clavipes]|nr:uncharacterized protein TNCV_1423651 [Trichonephila clavipes]